MPYNKQDSLTIKHLLTDYQYKVPVYQRNYDWGEPQIEQLIDDIYDYAIKANAVKANAIQNSANTKQKSFYYIGSLVVHRKKDYFEVLDGQQRLTTISLLAIYIKHRLPKVFDDYQQPNLGFESRTKSNFTIKKIFDVYITPENTGYTTPEEFSVQLSTVDGQQFNSAIVAGFEAIDQVITRKFRDSSISELSIFGNYLLNNVKILRVCVPKNTDVTHYFEVMNTRGEQLEKHEVVKAKLLSTVQDDWQAMSTIQKIWLACANMNRYVQTGFDANERVAIFGDKAEGFTEINFDDLSKVINVKEDTKNSVSISTQSSQGYSLEEVLIEGQISKGFDYNKDNKDDKDEGRAERFTSVIDFPNFLMQVLRLYVKNKTISDALPPLDDKALIEAFDRYLTLNSAADSAASVKDFMITLLKTRYMFDRYIVKREQSNKGEDWSLKRYKFESGSSSYVLTYVQEETDDMQGSLNESCLMLLSAFHVSYPTHSRKNWLSAVLNWLLSQEQVTETTAQSYQYFLQSLAKAFLLNRYLVDKPIEYSEFMYGNTEALNSIPHALSTAEDAISNQLRYGKVTIFVFNYLDYLLWKSSAFNFKYRNEFRFSSKNSVEHFSPQTSIVRETVDDDTLHGFGNLCLIGHRDNSSLGNDTPRQKAERLEGKRSQMAPLSLKLELMMVQALDKWDVHAIKQHQNRMVGVLKTGLELMS